MTLDAVDDIKNIAEAEFRYKGTSAQSEDTPNGIFLDGDRQHLEPYDIQVVFDKGGPTVKGVDKQDIKLSAGEHGLHIKRGDLEFDTDKFILKRGETVTLRIEWFKEGKVQFVVRVVDGRIGEIASGKSESVDCTLQCSYAEACAFVQGAVDREVSYMRGDLKIDGNYVVYLLRLQPLFESAEFAAAGQSLRERTQF